MSRADLVELAGRPDLVCVGVCFNEHGKVVLTYRYFAQSIINRVSRELVQCRCRSFCFDSDTLLPCVAFVNDGNVIS